MGLRDRIQTMGFGLPDMGALQRQFDEKFGELVDHLVEINATLGLILEELRKGPAQ